MSEPLNGRCAAWAGIRHIAHRCGGRLAPENTLAGIRVAAEHGFRAVEFDVMLSAGGTPILIHDETLDRTTSGSGDVARASDSLLAGLLANRGFEAAFPDARIPELRQAIAVCHDLGMAMNIEIKPAAGADRATASAVAAAIAETIGGGAGYPLPPLISSFSEQALRVARDLLPGLPFALLVGKVPGDWPDRLRALGCSSLHTAAEQDDWTWLAAARRAGIAVRCYTVNDREVAQGLFSRGIEAVFTDALDLVAARATPATS